MKDAFIEAELNDQKPSCLDSAYERKAIDDGWTFDVSKLFPENRHYYLNRQHIKEWVWDHDTKQYELYLGPTKREHI
jgi:hypothetical protein